MKEMNRRLEEKKEQVALKISLGAGILFVLVELLVAILSKSQAVLMDSVYDTSELVMILFSLKLVPLLYKPVSEKQPYGYSQVESLFIAIKGFVLVSVTVALIVNNVQIMFHGGRDVQFLPIAYFELFATVLGGAVMLILRRMNRLANSPILRTEIMERTWIISDIPQRMGGCTSWNRPACCRSAGLLQKRKRRLPQFFLPCVCPTRGRFMRQRISILR